MIASVFNADNPNVPMLELVVHALGDLCESLVFVGGCATGLLVTSFHNRWYPLAVATAQLVRLPSGHVISLIAPPVFIATKLEAFHDRGEGDFFRQP